MPTILDDKRAQAAREREGGKQQRQSASASAPGVVVSEDFTPQDGQGPLPEHPELGASEQVPPAYSEQHDQLSLHQAGFDAGATITDDGRVNININQTNVNVANFIAPALRNQLVEDRTTPGDLLPIPPAYIPPSLGGHPGQTPPPRLNVVIQIVGSRGDVQPFVALGQVLRDTYGHRVRIATHPTFEKFVEDAGLEFFSIGGDPAELMAFMVKNPGLMPGVDALKNGEITKRRKGIEEIVLGCWRSCIEAGKGLGPAPRFPRHSKTDDPTTMPQFEVDEPTNRPFIADAIIANPPSFAHIHVAEKLGVPLHLMFTMPWSPTRAFPQPLANIQSSNTDPVTTNYVSYALVEMMTWQGLGDVINRFRTKVLDLEPLSLLWAPAVLTRLRIPYTYCWSPALIPKPADWGNHIDIAGFFFLNLASSFTPDPELDAFLKAGPPPIYIGFGSIVVDDPNGLTRMIFDAVAETGVRALVSKGWGGLGADSVGIPEGVYMLGNVPHDWLFEHVSAVCHHGGAGTTAAGINAGKPTIVVPFFGDQPFWGAMVHRAGAGPEPIPYKQLTASALAEAIRVAIKPETLERARELGAKIREEKGADVGGQCFHNHLDVDSLRCSIVPSRVAVWRVRRSTCHLSALAATHLVNSGYLTYSDLKLFRGKEYSTEDHPTDPISACSAALLGDIGSIGMSIADIPRDVFKAAKAAGKKQSDKDQTTDDAATTTSNNASATSMGGGPSEVTLSTASEGAETASKTSVAPASTIQSSDQTQSTLSPSSTQIGSGSGAGGSSSRSAAAASSVTKSEGLTPERLEKAFDAAKGINNIVATGMKSPMNFCMGLARGFRNAPRLYNDDTIRPTEKVTSFSSGLKVAGKEFGFGLFDGISGLVTQPMRGAAKEGGVGAMKGIGKGIGGLVFKSGAAFWSIPAYTMAGVHAEIRGLFAQSAQNYITASRIWQGNDELLWSTPEERQDIEIRWGVQKSHLKSFYALKQKDRLKSKGKGKDTSPDSSRPVSPSYTGSPPPAGSASASTSSFFDQRSVAQSQRDPRQSPYGPYSYGTLLADSSSTFSRDEDDVFERAILDSIRQTSRGDAAEDARVEQAVRSGVALLRRRSHAMASTSSLVSAAASIISSEPRGDTRATSVSQGPVGASAPAAEQSTGQPPSRSLVDDKRAHANVFDDLAISDEEYQNLIEQAVQMSMNDDEDHESWGIRMHDNEAEDEEDEEKMREILERSRTERSHSDEHDDEDYKKALADSEAAHAAQLEGVDSAQDEEEALRKAIEASQAEEQQPPQEDEEELRRALEESQKIHEQELAQSKNMQSDEEKVLEYVKQQSLAEEQARKQKGKQAGGDEADEDDDELKQAIERSMQEWQELRGGGGSGSGGGAGASGSGSGPGSKATDAHELPS
ncbi:uncharacterized protein B0I36DRAFT_372610 [Microdochium trichocladiopsis]|uniref:Glycosyltransferase family 28 N-terminal domain-containing protein n=1 Tax=Microdochium trichocladiopsis TaxID=1682393 RepID=A0A9P8YD36_9PEZI|nr:uncharacterized protein B0I36DRAFT_372610 [Microdochium trichocladiopsis]KAH7034736.1 hypothetical protein B0I36DRAFT_372610 [Microdochium trichocladiopsis]